MDTGARRPTPSGDLTAAGRRATKDELRRRLGTAPAEYLAGALENPACGEAELLAWLRNRDAPAELLLKIGADARWTRRAAVRRLLVHHPNVPLIVARRQVEQMFWMELAEVAADLQVNPLIRRRAEELLRLRVGELGIGERVALARRATRGLVSALIHAQETAVLRALLNNSRLVERDAIQIAAGSQAPGALLASLAADPKWGPRRAVRMALLRNPRTPVPTALRVTESIPRRDLRELIRDAKVPQIVRVGAARRLAREG